MTSLSSTTLIYYVVLIIFNDAKGQIDVFYNIEEHSARITALESSIANITTCCATLRAENVALKLINANLTTMLTTLVGEVGILKQQVMSMSASQSGGMSTTSNTKQTSSNPVLTYMQGLTASTTQMSPSMTPAVHVTNNRSVDAKDCADLYKKGVRQSGLYSMKVTGNDVPVYCDMDDDGGGWTVIQRRRDGSVNFNVNWNMYRNGFGNLSDEFWLGNELIYHLTNRANNHLRISVMDWTRVTGFADYKGFYVLSESTNYKLAVGAYSGTIGDSFNYPDSYMLRHRGMPFSTKDKDHDHSFNNCARILQGGWWFSSCYSSNLNGAFLKNGPYGTRTMGEISGQPTLEGTGIEWYPWKHKQYSLIKSEMKIRPLNFP